MSLNSDKSGSQARGHKNHDGKEEDKFHHCLSLLVFPGPFRLFHAIVIGMNENAPKKDSPTGKVLTPILVPIAILVILGGVFAWLGRSSHLHTHSETASGESLSDLEIIEEDTEVRPLDLKIGLRIPDFPLYSLAGERTYFSKLPDAKIVLLNFWATWCGPCLMEIPSIVELWKKYKSKGLKVVLLNVDDDPEQVVPRFIEQLEIPFPVYKDHKQIATALFNVSGLPTTLVMNSKGEVLYFLTGERDWNDGSVQKQMEKWLQ